MALIALFLTFILYFRLFTIRRRANYGGFWSKLSNFTITELFYFLCCFLIWWHIGFNEGGHPPSVLLFYFFLLIGELGISGLGLLYGIWFLFKSTTSNLYDRIHFGINMVVFVSIVLILVA